MKLRMDIPMLHAFLEREFPQVSGEFAIEVLDEDRIVVRQIVAERHLRPGGTISGPTMFALADVTIYLAVLSHIGPVPLAVTTNCTIDFMRKPVSGRDLLAEGRLLKLGRRLAVGDVFIRSEGNTDVVARAGLTFAIPPERT